MGAGEEVVVVDAGPLIHLLHVLIPQEVTEFSHTQNLTSLHVGEQECLFVCKRLSVPLLLTDDLAARDAAKHLGLEPVGSLGVVVRAYRQSIIPLDDAERFLGKLYAVSSLFVTRDIVEIAIQQLHTASE